MPGADLTLTLDQTLQFEAERQLMAAVDQQGAKSGVAIVGDPRSGELLAVANVERNKETNVVSPVANNMAFTASYEAGSVMKLVTVAGAFETGKTDPDEVLAVPWRLTVGDHEYSDHDWHPTEQWRVDDIVAKSSNIGTVMLAKRLGAAGLEHALRDFGFGSSSPLGLPGETGGILSASKGWYPTDLASIAIGQGVAVTPIQLWSAYNVVANEGMYVPPRLVEDGAFQRQGRGDQAGSAAPRDPTRGGPVDELGVAAGGRRWHCVAVADPRVHDCRKDRHGA